MSKDATQDLMMGAVVVVLAYAMYRHFKPASAPARAPVGSSTAPRPSSGVSWTNDPTGPTTLWGYINGDPVADNWIGKDYLSMIAPSPLEQLTPPPTGGPVNTDTSRLNLTWDRF